MKAYRFARRSFLRGVGAAAGLKILLRNLEASAQGATSPPRFLMTHWPVGTVRYHFVPTGSGSTFTTSRILKPFETAGLRDDTIILYGLSADGIGNGMGGGHEAGTPRASTGANCPGTRANGGEPDDAAAGGPSWDQIFLTNVPALQRPGAGYANAICDARVDSFETSTQCLSYGHATQQTPAARGGTNGVLTENIPLLPQLSPLQLYTSLFSGFVPGGATDQNAEKIKRALAMRKSVLDFALDELAALQTLAPASEAGKIQLHADAIRKVEQQLSDQIAAGTAGGMGAMACVPSAAPAASLMGKTGSGGIDYSKPTAATADDAAHESIGKTHAAIIRAAFQCDIIRVATFQWSPGTNHVSFGGLYPGNPSAIYMHHPVSHRITDINDLMTAPPSSGANLQQRQEAVEFLANVFTWYSQKMADILVDFKNATDGFGGKLLDTTIVPYITEVAEATHSNAVKPALIFGGRKLGMKGGQYLNFEGKTRPHNDLWVTIAQAYLGTNNPLPMLTSERFVKTGVSPIPGVWSPPA